MTADERAHALLLSMIAGSTPQGVEALARAVLWERLLLLAYAYGTDTGISAVAADDHAHSETDLRYTARRHFTIDGARAVAIQLANATFAARQSHIWGESTTTVAPTRLATTHHAADATRQRQRPDCAGPQFAGDCRRRAALPGRLLEGVPDVLPRQAGVRGGPRRSTDGTWLPTADAAKAAAVTAEALRRRIERDTGGLRVRADGLRWVRVESMRVSHPPR